MTNLKNLVLPILLLVVLGCSCSRLGDLLDKKSPPPPPPPTSPSSTPKVTDSSDDKAEYVVTRAKFDQIKTGMNRTEVERIMGGHGTEYFNSKGGGSTFLSVKYTNDDHDSILVSYMNDKVTSKTQVGLDK